MQKLAGEPLTLGLVTLGGQPRWRQGRTGKSPQRGALALSWAQGKRQCWAPTKGLGKKLSNCYKPAPPLLHMFLRICVHARGGLGEGTQQAFQKAGEPHACRKGGCGGGWGIPAMSPLASGKCLQRNMKPGQGSCCSSFFVVPPYANPVSASWHGQLAWLNNPSWIATWSGLWLEVEVERAAPQPRLSWPCPKSRQVGGLDLLAPQSLTTTVRLASERQVWYSFWLLWGGLQCCCSCGWSALARWAAPCMSVTCVCIWPLSSELPCTPGGLTGAVLSWRWAGAAAGAGRQGGRELGEAGGPRAIGSSWLPHWLAKGQGERWRGSLQGFLGAACPQPSAGGLTAGLELWGSWRAGQPDGRQAQGLHTQNPHILGAILPQATGAVWPRTLLVCLRAARSRGLGGRCRSVGGTRPEAWIHGLEGERRGNACHWLSWCHRGWRLLGQRRRPLARTPLASFQHCY